MNIKSALSKSFLLLLAFNPYNFILVGYYTFKTLFNKDSYSRDLLLKVAAVGTLELLILIGMGIILGWNWRPIFYHSFISNISGGYVIPTVLWFYSFLVAAILAFYAKDFFKPILVSLLAISAVYLASVMGSILPSSSNIAKFITGPSCSFHLLDQLSLGASYCLFLDNLLGFPIAAIAGGLIGQGLGVFSQIREDRDPGWRIKISLGLLASALILWLVLYGLFLEDFFADTIFRNRY